MIFLLLNGKGENPMVEFHNASNKSSTERKQSAAPGSTRDQSRGASILSDLAGYSSLVPVSKELIEYEDKLMTSMSEQLKSRNLRPESLKIHKRIAETNGLRFTYFEYADGDLTFAACNYYEESYRKTDGLLSNIGGNPNYDGGFGTYNVNNRRNIETMDESCKEAIKITLDKDSEINIKDPYIVNAIDRYSYNRAEEHAMNITKQIASIYSIRSPELKLSSILPRNVRINMHYLYGDRAREIMVGLYPNGVVPRCDFALVATGTDTQNSYDGLNQGSQQRSLLGAICGYMDFTKNNNSQNPHAPSNHFGQIGQYTPVVKIDANLVCGRFPFISLLMISYAYQFFCTEGKWSIHMREENFLNSVSNLGNLFYKKKERENSKAEVMSCKKPSDLDQFLDPSSGCFTSAILALEIVDSHFADPILKLIDSNKTPTLLNYLRNFTDMAIEPNAIPSLLYGQTTNIVGTITKNTYDKAGIEVDSRYLSTYLDLLLQYPEAIQEDDLKMFLFYNDASSIAKTNYVDAKTGNSFNKKFKCNTSILHPAFIKLLAEVVANSGINLIGDNSHNGNPNLNNGSLNFGNDYFANLNGIPQMGNYGGNFTIQNNSPFNKNTYGF